MAAELVRAEDLLGSALRHRMRELPQGAAHPDVSRSHHWLGVVCVKVRERSHLWSAVDPTLPSPAMVRSSNHWLGVVCVKRGRVEDAIEHFELAWRSRLR